METKIQIRKPEVCLMLFFAQTENKEYKIEVQEVGNEWIVTLIDQRTNEKETHHIPKKDYQQFGEVLSFLFENRSYLIDIIAEGDNFTAFTKGSHKHIYLITEEKILHNKLTTGNDNKKDIHIKSGMPGKIVEVRVKSGDSIQENDLLLIIEAMKMENEILASKSGKIKKVHVTEKQNVEAGSILISLTDE